jgi:hypothetical protein
MPLYILFVLALCGWIGFTPSQAQHPEVEQIGIISLEGRVVTRLHHFLGTLPNGGEYAVVAAPELDRVSVRRRSTKVGATIFSMHLETYQSDKELEANLRNAEAAIGQKIRPKSPLKTQG